MRAWIKAWIERFSTILRYGANSIITTLVDTAIVWILVKLGVGIVAANTVGVLVGFVLGYVLTAAYVFQAARGRLGFVIYLGTFGIGLGMADWLIWWGHTAAFAAFGEGMNFLLSKGLSIVLPFFVMYFLRKGLYAWCDRRKE